MDKICWLFALHTLTGAAHAQWSPFDPIADPEVPVAVDQEWSAPIDAFVHARLLSAQLSPAPAVDRRTWLRRVSFDLIGLPPTPTEVQEFLGDPRPDLQVMGEAADRLLSSPRYGERWGRHWLDVVRYADSDGFAIDKERATHWRFRDYTIQVFNRDGPFDEFFRAQLAGDEMQSGAEGAVAMSFFRLGPYEADNMTPQNRRQDYLNEVTSAVGSAFLGLTVGCARCHDHRFDPIPQSDFYRLQAFFTPLQRKTIPAPYLPHEVEAGIQRQHENAVGRRLFKSQQLSETRNKLRKKIADQRGIKVDAISDEELDKVVKSQQPPLTKDELKRLNELSKAVADREVEERLAATAVAVANPASQKAVPTTFVLENGDPFQQGDPVVPGFPSALPTWSQELVDEAGATAQQATGRRQLLAAWLTSSENPLPARVLVNRVWQYHFGMGIVATPNDFGQSGSGPSHPQLLDYLAQRLIAGGWKLKPLHRELVLSRTYRQSIHNSNATRFRQLDPDNRLLWRTHYRRLEAETLRDAMLAVSGSLNLEVGGPGFYEALPNGMQDKYSFFSWQPSSEDQRRRRSVYMFQRRNLVHPMMEAFDGPDLNQSCERRSTSVTAPQALSLLNGRMAHENADRLAKRLRAYSTEPQQRVERLYWLALSRPPEESEMSDCLAFLQKAGPDPEAQRSSLRDLCLAIINTNEFLYLD